MEFVGGDDGHGANCWLKQWLQAMTFSCSSMDMNYADTKTRRTISKWDFLSVAEAIVLICSLPFIHCLLTFSLLFPENQAIGSAVFVGVLLFGGAGLVAAAIVVPISILCVRRSWDRLFVRIAMVIALAAISTSVFKRWQSPPSAARYFQLEFGSTMPPSAQKIRVHHVPFDGLTVLFFSCTAADCTDLVQQLGMKENPLSPDYPRENLSFFTVPLKGTPDCSLWKNSHLFERREGRTGRIDSLLCDASGTQVFLYKDPLASKTDAEMNGDYTR
ncbi:MAG: hypothetical protein ABL974_11680 [Prosthecobacter sp.]